MYRALIRRLLVIPTSTGMECFQLRAPSRELFREFAGDGGRGVLERFVRAGVFALVQRRSDVELAAFDFDRVPTKGKDTGFRQFRFGIKAGS
jgi:hypothetical protein